MSCKVFLRKDQYHRRDRLELGARRDSLERQSQPMYIAGFVKLEILLWLEPHEWEVIASFGGVFFEFKDARVATMFKLTFA